MLQEYTFHFTRVSLIREAHGPDHLMLDCAHKPSPYPNLENQFPGEYTLTLKTDCQRGYAEEWCNKMGLTIDFVVDESVK
jgi:hypothetical protein